MLRSRVSLLAISVVAVLFFAGSASAADSIWWSSFNAGVFSHTTLTGGSGTNVLPSSVGPNAPYGSVVDAATGKLYWANFAGDTISVSNLDGSGATILNTGMATVQGPSGVAIEPAAGKIYWTNQAADKISWAYLNGGGGGDLDTTGASVDMPRGITVYPNAGRVYWANYASDKISWAFTEGGGGGEVSVPAADIDGPEGLAVDSYTNFIYWANHDGGSIGYAGTSGHNGGLLPITGVPIVHPTGVAIDPEAGLVNPLETARIYWADEGAGGIFSAALAGGVAERIKTGAGNDTEPAYPFLFEAPKESPRFSNPRVPEVRLGQTLSCGTQSIWRPDLPESFVFRAPQSFGYQWTKGGVAIPGATGLKLTPTVGGDYACNLLATNAAGTAEGVGITWRVRRYEGPPGSPLLRILKVRHSLKGGTAQILVKVADPGTLTLEGRKVKLRTISCPGAEVVKVRVQAKGGALNKLKRTGKVKVPIKLRLRIEGSEASIPLVITLRMRTRG